MCRTWFKVILRRITDSTGAFRFIRTGPKPFSGHSRAYALQNIAFTIFERECIIY